MRSTRALVASFTVLLLGACGDASSAPLSTTPPNGTDATIGSTAPTSTTVVTSSPGTEAPDTEGITFEEDQAIPPIPPGSLSVEMTPEGPEVRWMGTGPDVAAYLVYGRPGPDDPWTQLGEVAPVGDNLGPYAFLVSGLEAGQFAVVSVDLDGNRSGFSEVAGSPG